jgi:hypothetical protein
VWYLRYSQLLKKIQIFWNLLPSQLMIGFTYHYSIISHNISRFNVPLLCLLFGANSEALQESYLCVMSISEMCILSSCKCSGILCVVNVLSDYWCCKVLYCLDVLSCVIVDRYKMISQFTWPNFRAGSDKDGTRVLIEERHFEHDVKYGKTKIFIRSPATLFALETVRLYGHGFFMKLEQSCM